MPTIKVIAVSLSEGEGSFMELARFLGGKHIRIYIAEYNIYFDLDTTEDDIVLIRETNEDRDGEVLRVRKTDKSINELRAIKNKYWGINKKYSVTGNNCEKFCQYFIHSL